MPARPLPFDRDAIERAFERLGELAVAAGKVVEISVYGGAVLVLALEARPATSDVDAVFEKDRAFIRQSAAIIADEFDWSADWINDSVKGFLSRADTEAGAKRLFRSYPAGIGEGLRVFVASPAYLFAMTCLAMRTGDTAERGSTDDILQLGAELGITSVHQAIALVSRFYPPDTLRTKTRFGLEELFGSAYS